MTEQSKLPGNVRSKSTTPDEILPCVAELVGDRPTILRYVDLNGQQTKLDYRELTKFDPFVIPMPIDREGYGKAENSSYFWATGHGDWLNLRTALQRYHSPQDHANDGEKRSKLRLFDFGCATGRFLRHAYAFGREEFDIWGSDFAPANVDWSRRYLSPEFNIILNCDTPHLPFEDDYFDVVTAFSVFPHIDLFEQAWLLELRRITRPGGILYLTVQNDAAWSRVTSDADMLSHMHNANKFEGNIKVSEQLFQSSMPSDRIVFRMSNKNVYNRNVWITNEYIRSNWQRFFKVHCIADNAHTEFQSPVILSPE